MLRDHLVLLGSFPSFRLLFGVVSSGGFAGADWGEGYFFAPARPMVD